MIKNLCYLSVVATSLLLSACQKQIVEINEASEPKLIETLTAQQQLDALAKNLQVKYKFFSNVETDCPDLKGKPVQHCYSAEIILSLPELSRSYFTDKQSWQLNYSQVYPSYVSSSEQLNLSHLNGDIHQVSPKANFTGFKAGQTHKVKLWVKSTLITESELMPNYWLAKEGLTAAIVDSTLSQVDKDTGLEIQPWVIPFTNLPKQIKSSPDDINQYASTQWLYDNEPKGSTDNSHVAFAIIPTPKSIVIADKNARLDLANGIKVNLSGGIQYPEVVAAFERLATLGIKETSIGIAVNIELNDHKHADWRLGHYQLVISDSAIIIKAQDSSGAFYALQSLASLITVRSTLVPLVDVEDQPHYDYRGQHVDVARNFHSKAFMFSLIKQMAAYKLNKLHLHLAEDEGWRLELPSLPELTQIGSKRCLDLSDTQCLQPQLGGGANDRDGYYSVDDYQEILRMASKHHIQVIPSLDMPGHSRAAIKAMEARYHYYMNQENETEAKRYLLTDFTDKTQYSSIQNYNDNTLNICMESTYTFVDRVLDDLKALHQLAEHPLGLYHIGADETAGAWLESPVCQALIADTTNNFGDAKHLGAHFIERVAHMVASKGIAVGGWNDGLKETDVTKMPGQVYSYVWDALPWGAHKQLSEQAHRNWNIILSTPDVLYFDFPYQIDPKERGYHWASRRVTTRSLFNFMPDNLPVHAEFRFDTLGQSYLANDEKQRDKSGKVTHQPLPKGFSISGIQGQLWSETVRSDAQAQYMLYPRLLALAERAWHQASWQVPYNEHGAKYDKNTNVFSEKLRQNRDKQWLEFSITIGEKELAKLDLAGVFYRVPTVGANIDSGVLSLNIAIKGLPIEYQIKGGQWLAYREPVMVKGQLEVRARTLDKQRAGRAMVVTQR
ncbi:family 20 glycosylhydrolase [Colwellia psychrerythraea]|uniref:beta-N-acetylhexosaminidase n=1 Tax=Colwellia psychrerythraea TaxID=28229 RepID=A0A099KMG5_COLPS|nr:family 20 glycosylhydrolase [Colwellia psychrerythraea]KGJ91626.1 Beta-N-acetylhexosaminidase [Colwellia psychrerythraea]